MKKNKPFGELFCSSLKKTLLIMRIAVILMILGILQARANEAYSQKTKLSINLYDVPLVTVLDKIEIESEFFFLYNEKLFDSERKVTIDVKDQLINTILDNLFASTDIKYTIIDRKIILAPDYLTSDPPQQKQITGTITDESGNPLPGVNILVEGTTTGAISDINGKYTISIPNDNVVIDFSFIGYDIQKVSAKGKTIINVSLIPVVSQLNEVIVVGYGTQRKADLTGSVSAVKESEYLSQPINRVDQILQGRTAGVNVTNASGAPGGASQIRIRGSNSITGDNDPLYVIDGFVGASFQDVNPTDIENIQVLKDASSTAIYGSRGANGVVLITTKSGVAGKPRLSLTARYITSQVAKIWPLLDAGTFAETANLRADALGSAHVFTDAQVADFKVNGGTDWQNSILRTGNGQEYQLDYSGGSDKVTYFISGNYLDQDGVVINSYFKRFSLRTNLDAKLSDKLKASLKVNFSSRTNNNTTGNYNTSGPIGNAAAWAPTTPAYDVFGKLTVRDPVSSIKANPIEQCLNDNITASNTFNANGGFNYTIIKGLTLDIGFGSSYNNIQGKYFSLNALSNAPSSSRNSTTNLFLQSTNTLTYTKTFNEIHKITATAVAEYQLQQTDYFNAAANGLLFPTLKYENLTLATTNSADAAYSKSTIGSYIGRVNYALKDRYLITASMRSDRSSKFRGNNQVGIFPSIGIGWRISEEDFMKGLGLDNLKLRASWGQTGSQAINVYGTVTSYNTDAGNAGASFLNGTLTSGINIGNPGNSGLKWETTTQSNVGFDLGVLKNRLSLEADYFIKYTTDLLLSEPLPGYTGGGNIYRNIGEIKNNGFEFGLKALIFDRSDFSWDASFNISLMHNEIVSLGSRDFISQMGGAGAGMVNFPEMILKPGYSISSYYGYRSLGIWQQNEAATAAIYGNVPGDYHYEDLNGDNVINGSDFQIIGSGIPKQILGFNNTFKYKGFTLNAFFQSMLGFEKWNFAYAQTMIAAADAREYLHVDILDRWSPTNTGSKVAAFSKTNRQQIQSSAYVEKGNYLRLKNLSLQYDLPKDLMKGINGSIQISGQNIWTLTKYKGLDPEAYSNVGPTDSRGGDGGAYPNAKIWTFGINLNF
jgi:TonB-dependent starch-binding outer membrane protein SusC